MPTHTLSKHCAFPSAGYVSFNLRADLAWFLSYLIPFSLVHIFLASSFSKTRPKFYEAKLKMIYSTVRHLFQ